MSLEKIEARDREDSNLLRLDLDELQAVHEAKRLRLATSVGLEGELQLLGSPTRLVDELIRLARIGQKALLDETR